MSLRSFGVLEAQASVLIRTFKLTGPVVVQVRRVWFWSGFGTASFSERPEKARERNHLEAVFLVRNGFIHLCLWFDHVFRCTCDVPFYVVNQLPLVETIRIDTGWPAAAPVCPHMPPLTWLSNSIAVSANISRSSPMLDSKDRMSWWRLSIWFRARPDTRVSEFTWATIRHFYFKREQEEQFR